MAASLTSIGKRSSSATEYFMHLRTEKLLTDTFTIRRARPGKRGIVPPFPPILERLVDHLINNNLLPADVRPDSCIINQYDRNDCIPPQ